MRSYPRHFLPWLWSIVGILFVSGLLLIPGVFELRLEWDVPASLGASRIAVAALHALGAFAMLFATGALWPVHMRLGLRQRRNLATGLLLVTWLGVLALTALGIYYIANPDWAVGLSLTHTALGVLLLVPFLWHWLRGRRMRRQYAH